jgi:hypothetical protein
VLSRHEDSLNQEQGHGRQQGVTMKKPFRRYDLLALLASIPLVYLVARMGILEPTCGAFGVIDHGLLLVLFTGIIVVTCVYGFRAKSTRYIIIAVVAVDVGACVLLSSDRSNAYAWSTYLVKRKSDLAKAVSMAKSHTSFKMGEKGAVAVSLPRSLNHLCKQGKMEVFTSGDGDAWYVFPMSTADIDHTVGLAWNAKGKCPPKEAYPDIVSSRSLGWGWYQFQST